MRKKSPLIVSLFFIAVFAILGMSYITALTATIDNPKMVLYKNITSGRQLVFENSVTVINENNFSVNITIKPDKSVSEYVVIQDKDFIIEPGEKKDASYTITLDKAGEYGGDIIVTFTDPEFGNQLSLAQRIVVQAKEVEGKSFNNKTIIYISLAFLIVLIIIFFVLLYSIKNKFYGFKRKK